MSEIHEILIDFSGIKSGGGVQLALNFLEEISSKSSPFLSFSFVFPSTGELFNYGVGVESHRCLFSPSNPAKRLLFEYVALQRWILNKRIEVCYTFFGAGIPTSDKVVSIVSVAYPIICYPDSPYWKNIDWKTLLRIRILNWARIKRLKVADVIITETPVMQRRLARELRRNPDDILVSPPAVSDFLTPVLRRKGSTFNIVCVSGLSIHKNLWRLPEIAYEIRKIDPLSAIRFNITVSITEWSSHVLPLLSSRKIWPAVMSMFIFSGNVPSSEIQRIYADADALLSLSDLESFSNNYMEAWRARIPLIVSDRDFARGICGESAIYIDPHCSLSSALIISKFAADLSFQDKMVLQGDRRLQSLPSRSEKVDEIFTLIKSNIK